MIWNLLLQGFIEIFNILISPFILIVSTLPIKDILNAFNSVSIIFESISAGVGILSYVAGGSWIIVLPLTLNTILIVSEFGLSILWWALHKTHIAGGGH
jgi:hypothetical protein